MNIGIPSDEVVPASGSENNRSSYPMEYVAYVTLLHDLWSDYDSSITSDKTS